MSFILGEKLKMGQIYEAGRVVPVTVVKAGPIFVTQIKTPERNGYAAVQVGFESAKKKKKSQPFNFRFLKEFRIDSANSYKEGDKLTVGVFNEGDKVKVSGLVKGRGFQGVVKRHGFGGGPKTHGQKNRLRAPGSIGATAPQRVLPGRKMAGRMGGNRVTVKNLKVVKVDAKKNILMIKGAVPGMRGTLLEIRK